MDGEALPDVILLSAHSCIVLKKRHSKLADYKAQGVFLAVFSLQNKTAPKMSNLAIKARQQGVTAASPTQTKAFQRRAGLSAFQAPSSSPRSEKVFSGT